MRYLLRLTFLAFIFSAVPAGEVIVRPGQSIQQAIDEAQSGDKVILRDGVYHECIEINKPIHLKAEHGGKVTITNAYDGKLKFKKEPESEDLYSAKVKWPVRWVMAGDRNLYNYVKLDNLNTFIADPNYCRLNTPGHGFREGFAWVEGRLYLRMKNGQNPNNTKIEINSADMDGRIELLKNNGLEAFEKFYRPDTTELRLVYKDWVWIVNYWPEVGVIASVNTDNVTIEGLRFHLAPDVAIDVKKGDNITIRDCFFEGYQYAVNTWEHTSNITVEYCEFSGGRLYERLINSKAHRDTIYFANLEINTVAQKGSGFVFRHNYVYEGFDGIQPRGVAAELISTVKDIPSDISYNVFINFIDNNVESDGWDRLMNVRIHHNLVFDGLCLLSVAPTQRGPLQIDHNLFYSSPEKGINRGVLIKHSQPAGVLKPFTGLTVVHNTFVLPRQNIQPVRDDFTYKDNIVENNIMVVNRSNPWDAPGYTPSKYNLVHGGHVSEEHLPQCIHADPKFVRFKPIDFRLSADSPAMGAGINRDDQYQHNSKDCTDLGAIEYGGNWDFPKPGPRWATDENMPQRPEWPKSISPKWGGFSNISF